MTNIPMTNHPVTKNCEETEVYFVSKSDVEGNKKFLDKRWKNLPRKLKVSQVLKKGE